VGEGLGILRIGGRTQQFSHPAGEKSCNIPLLPPNPRRPCLRAAPALRHWSACTSSLLPADRGFKILDELEPEGIVISKRGRLIAKLTPLRAVDNAKLIGSMKGKVVVKGDILSTGRTWGVHSTLSPTGAKGRQVGRSGKMPG
jgi:antitoxin (DNA-binding transcriptional repressor) of toxin-antitoxin stability system